MKNLLLFIGFIFLFISCDKEDTAQPKEEEKEKQVEMFYKVQIKCAYDEYFSVDYLSYVNDTAYFGYKIPYMYVLLEGFGYTDTIKFKITDVQSFYEYFELTDFKLTVHAESTGQNKIFYNQEFEIADILNKEKIFIVSYDGLNELK